MCGHSPLFTQLLLVNIITTTQKVFHTIIILNIIHTSPVKKYIVSNPFLFLGKNYRNGVYIVSFFEMYKFFSFASNKPTQRWLFERLDDP